MDDKILSDLLDMLELYFLLEDKTNSKSIIELSSSTKPDEDDAIFLRLQLLKCIELALNEAGYEKKGCKDETQQLHGL